MNIKLGDGDIAQMIVDGTINSREELMESIGVDERTLRRRLKPFENDGLCYKMKKGRIVKIVATDILRKRVHRGYYDQH